MFSPHELMTHTVVVGAFAHETNTFIPEPVDRMDFQARRELFGDEVTETFHGTETALGGAIGVAETQDIELVQTVAALATPGGPVASETYDAYTTTILEGIQERLDDLDGIFLPLHGAMVTEDHIDGEGVLIERVRNLVGGDVPIVVTLDLHANVSEQMVEAADVLAAYETYPHVDKADTGRRGMELLINVMDGVSVPTMHMERPPMIAFQPKAYTPDGPMADVMARARDLEARPDVLKVNVLPGFYHADVPEMGFTIPVVTDDDPDLAREVSRELAAYVWERRNQFVEEYPGPAEAIRRAKEIRATLDPDDGPIVMADFGSNPGGGGAADGTTILREMLEHELENAGWAIMYDPATVAACNEIGVGERVTVTVGGKTDDRHGAPIEDLNGYVKTITDGRYVNTGRSHSGKGVQNEIGRTVRFQCGVNDSLELVIAETRASAFDAEIWRHVGLPPERLDYICIPSLIAFLADYEPLSSEVILVDTPGASAVDPERFDYSRIPRPIFPLDEIDEDDYPNWE